MGDMTGQTPDAYPLQGKKLLVVDDEPDVLETIEEVLDQCEVHTAGAFDTGLKLLVAQSYDIVILDIMGVNGFELLEKCVQRGFPAIMLTAPAMNPDYLIEALERGAVSYMPKEDLVHLESRIKEVLELMDQGMRPWEATISRLDPVMEERYGQVWKEKLTQFLKDKKF
jgi:DNA-binding response OmpR family regulator